MASFRKEIGDYHETTLFLKPYAVKEEVTKKGFGPKGVQTLAASLTVNIKDPEESPEGKNRGVYDLMLCMG